VLAEPGQRALRRCLVLGHWETVIGDSAA
jgi:hypothetical protein